MKYDHPSIESEFYTPLRGVDGFTLAGLAIIIFLAFHIGISSLRASSEAPNILKTDGLERSSVTRDHPLFSSDQSGSLRSSSAVPIDSIIYPYERFTLTQGSHGASYGHMAIDLSAGAGSEINSPISGKIAALFKDEIGNPTLVIENEIYEVTLLHGLYSVFIGQEVEQGQVIGKESNAGYTTDMLGRSCLGRECGHHTHLNIFDKSIGANVNPMAVLGK